MRGNATGHHMPTVCEEGPQLEERLVRDQRELLALVLHVGVVVTEGAHQTLLGHWLPVLVLKPASSGAGKLLRALAIPWALGRGGGHHLLSKRM
jgi:hypothetical protein